MKWMLMPLRRFAEFRGRSRRMEYWMWKLGLVVVYVVITILYSAIFAPRLPFQTWKLGLITVWAVFGLVILIPDLAVSVRRLHDTNRSGWWVLAGFGPSVVTLPTAIGIQGMAGVLIDLVAVAAAIGLGITFLVLMILEGTKGENRYGPEPKSQE